MNTSTHSHPDVLATLAADRQEWLRALAARSAGGRWPYRPPRRPSSP